MEQLRIADAYSCVAAEAPWKIKHCSTGLGVFAARAFSKGDFNTSYCSKMVYYDLSLRQHKRKVYGNRAL